MATLPFALLSLLWNLSSWPSGAKSSTGIATSIMIIVPNGRCTLALAWSSSIHLPVVIHFHKEKRWNYVTFLFYNTGDGQTGFLGSRLQDWEVCAGRQLGSPVGSTSWGSGGSRTGQREKPECEAIVQSPQLILQEDRRFWTFAWISLWMWADPWKGLLTVSSHGRDREGVLASLLLLTRTQIPLWGTHPHLTLITSWPHLNLITS